MKNITGIIILAIGSVTAFAQQSPETPRTEFTVSLSEKSVSLDKGQTKTVTVLLNRSKGFKKSKATFGVSTTLPKGITVAYEPTEGDANSSKAIISATPEVAYGVYKVILNSTLQNKTKGSILSIEVRANEGLVSAN